MYSVVLMMALSGSGEAPEFGKGCSCACSGYACSGCRGSRGCHGCRGSSCHGCRGSACHGCRGSACHGCRGCHGRSYCCGCAGTVVVTCAGGCDRTTPPLKKMPDGKKKKKAPDEVDAPAVIQVTLPADARLTVDGHPTTSTSENRTFVTPALPDGEFQYTLRPDTVPQARPAVDTPVPTTTRPTRTLATP